MQLNAMEENEESLSREFWRSKSGREPREAMTCQIGIGAVVKSEPVAGVRKWSATVLAALLFLGLDSPGAAAAGESTDTQFWNEAKLTIRLDDRFDLVAGGMLRFGDDVSKLIRSSSLLAVNVRVTSFLSLTPTYQYIVHDPAMGGRTVENRLGFVPTLTAPLGGAKASLSNAIEYRSFDNDPDAWRWRPKLKLSHALGQEALALSAYVAGELFYDFRSNSWTRSRLFAGLEKRISDHMALELYYCRQVALKANQQDLNIVGLTWRIDFDPKTRPGMTQAKGR
jgi:hypothetical protein